MVGPGESHILYILGIVVVAAYLPLYFWRKLTDKRRAAVPELATVLAAETARRTPRPRWSRKDDRHACSPGTRQRAAAPGRAAAAQPPPLGRPAHRPGGGAHRLHRGADPAGRGQPGGRASAAAQPVAVVSLARIYGSALGLPNPGLLPTQRELSDQRDRVGRALGALRRAGLTASGQVAATRRPGRTIAKVARAHGARYVILVAPGQARWRRVVEGNLVREISRRLSPATTVEAVITIAAQP